MIARATLGGTQTRRAPRNRLAWAAAAVMAAAVLAALLAPVLPLIDPDAVDTPNRLRPPGIAGHWLGTDEFGRDMLARLVWGARISLLAGVGTATASMLIGVLLGVHAGYWGGRVDTVVMRLIYARLARGVVLSLREREFVEAARALGSTDRLILRRHLLPHLMAPVVVAFSLDVGAKILATAGLSFLGLGTQPPTADWGSMLATARTFVILSPHVALLPGLAIFLVVLALNILGDALQDYLDPRMRHG
jgi:peptide/nickel transport system permease protein